MWVSLMCLDGGHTDPDEHVQVHGAKCVCVCVCVKVGACVCMCTLEWSPDCVCAHVGWLIGYERARACVKVCVSFKCAYCIG